MPRKPPLNLDEQLIGHISDTPSGMGILQLLHQFKGEVAPTKQPMRLEG